MWSAHYGRPHYNINQDDNQNFDQRYNETICSSKDFSGCQPYWFFEPLFPFSVPPQSSWLLSLCCFRYNFYTYWEYAMCRSSPDCTWCPKSSRKTVSVTFYPWQSSGFYWSDLPIFLIVERTFSSFLEASFSRLPGPTAFVLFATSPFLGGLYRYKNSCWQVRSGRANHVFPGSVGEIETWLFWNCPLTVCLMHDPICSCASDVFHVFHLVISCVPRLWRVAESRQNVSFESNTLVFSLHFGDTLRFVVCIADIAFPRRLLQFFFYAMDLHTMILMTFWCSTH